MTHRLAALVAITCSALVMPAWATPEDLDSGYGEGGVVSIAPPEMTRLRMTMRPDGSAVVAVAQWAEWSTQPGGLWRFDASGRPDTTFGDGGYVASSRLCSGASCNVLDVAADSFFIHVLLDDGRVVRLDAAGAIDLRFGVAGYASSVPYASPAAALAADAAGRLVVIGHNLDVDAPVIYRLRIDGTLDTDYGARPDRLGLVVLSPGVLVASLLERDGSLFATLSDETGTRIVRVRPDGTIDPAFGSAVFPAGALHLSALGRDRAGRLLAGGLEHLGYPRHRPIVVAFTAEGAIDARFGDSGFARIATDTEAPDGTVRAIALDREGRLVIAGNVQRNESTPFFLTRPHLLLARLLPDGRMDTTFAPAGQVRVRLAMGTAAHAVAVTPGGRIVAASGILEAGRPTGKYYVGRYRSALLAFNGGSTSYERLHAEGSAIEYVDRESGHYFVSAGINETRLLDTDVQWNRQWTRTGRAFNVWTVPQSDRLPVCRFWSGLSFAPKSSHFYTPYAGECNALQHGGVWSYEGDVFALKLPDPVTRACPVDARPLYRLYNDGTSGTPNHRYTVDPAVVDEMLARGWTLEGDAFTRVFACAPRHD